MKKAGIERPVIAAALSDFAFVFAFAELGALGSGAVGIF
jgi:hypothetical protein